MNDDDDNGQQFLDDQERRQQERFEWEKYFRDKWTEQMKKLEALCRY